MSKQTLLGIAAALAMSASSAGAADFPVKAPIQRAVPAASWTGFYVGIVGGAGWGRTGLAVAFEPDTETDGWSWGGTIGYNLQVGSTFVIGAEADFSWANFKGDRYEGVVFYGAETQSYGSVRARAGYLVSNGFMIFGTGGFGWAHTRIEVGIDPNFIHDTQTHSGLVYGGGAEFGFANNFTFKLEYLHFDLSKEAYRLYGTEHIRSRFDVIRGGINYRFGGPVLPPG